MIEIALYNSEGRKIMTVIDPDGVPRFRPILLEAGTYYLATVRRDDLADAQTLLRRVASGEETAAIETKLLEDIEKYLDRPRPDRLRERVDEARAALDEGPEAVARFIAETPEPRPDFDPQIDYPERYGRMP